MIKAFDPSNLKELRRDIDAAFAAIRAKHGVTLSLGNISYAPDKATTRLTMIAVGDASVANDPRAAALAKAQAEFKRYASSFGLKPEQFGATFTFGRDTYKIAGVKPRSTSYPILGTNVANGKTYKLPESAIASLQSKDHRDLFGLNTPTPTAAGMCSNDNAYDEKFNPIGKCNRAATTSRREGFGRHGRQQPFCAQCASLIDESRAEMAAEGRAS